MPYKYKVAQESFPGLFVSCSAQGAAEIVYKLNQYVTPPDFLKEKGYYLFVFDTLEHARAFATITNKVFKCKVKGHHRIKGLPTKLDLVELGEGKIQPEVDPYVKHYPIGTEMWEYVKLIEEVT